MHYKLKTKHSQRGCSLCQGHISLSLQTRNSVASPCSDVTSDPLGFTPGQSGTSSLALPHLQRHSGPPRWAGRGLLASLCLLPELLGASEVVPSLTAMCLSEEKAGPQRRGPTVPGLMLRCCQGPLMEHKRSLSSCLHFLGIQPE